MPMKNYQFNTILREYDSKRLKARHDLEEKKKRVYALIPQLETLDQQLVHGSVQSAKLSLYGDITALDELTKKNHSLSLQKQELMQLHGFPSDYLSPLFECMDCQDTGFIGNEKCHCFKQNVVNLLYSQSNVQEAILYQNFSNFSYQYYSDSYVETTTGLTPLQNIQRVVDKAKQFIQCFDNARDNLLIYGNTGVGKTFLSNCIAKELLDTSHTVIYFTAFQFFDLLEKYKFGLEKEHEDTKNRFDYIFDCDLLIIDDIGTELNNAFINSQLYQCINERLLKQKSTIISTNLSFEQLKSTYSERIFSRIASNYILLKLIGEDIRPQLIRLRY